MDQNNLVVKLCAEGMQAEAEGKPDDARLLFERAWDASLDDYDACIAAHYLARHQPTAESAFKWNQEALNRAGAVGDDRVRGFYPSLYLNMGHSCEMLGDLAEARRHYELAAEKLADVPDGPYKDIVRTGIEGGYQRTEAAAI